MEKLTIQEEELMLHIWSMGECFVKDIVAKFPEPKPVSYTHLDVYKRQTSELAVFS